MTDTDTVEAPVDLDFLSALSGAPPPGGHALPPGELADLVAEVLAREPGDAHRRARVRALNAAVRRGELRTVPAPGAGSNPEPDPEVDPLADRPSSIPGVAP